MLLAIEGVDGVGKTTVINYLKEQFGENPRVVFTKEPRYLKDGEKRWLLSLPDPIFRLSVFWRDHMEHQNEIILPNLKKGNIIVCDRGIYSRIAYQALEIAKYHEISPKEAIDFVDGIHRFSRWPDKVFIIWSDFDMLYDRLSKTHDGMDGSDIDKLLFIEDVYLEALKLGKTPYVGFSMNDGSVNIAAEIATNIIMELES